MGRVKSGSAVYRPDLGQSVMEFIEGPTTGYIGTRIMPIFKTSYQSKTFPVVPKEELLKIYDTSRSPRGAYKRGDFEMERGQFTTSEHGWEEPVDDSEESLLDTESPGISAFIATRRALNHVMRGQEKRIADKIFNATNFPPHAVTTEWDDEANSKPLTDVKDGIISFRNQCGMTPDALVISYTTFLDLLRNAQIIDQIKYTYPGVKISQIDASQLAQIFGLPELLVGGGVYDSAGKGIDTTIANIWSYEYAQLVKINGTMDLTEPCVGRTFLWETDSPQNPVVEEYREEETRSDIYRVRTNTDERLLASFDDTGAEVSKIYQACAWLFSNIHH